MVELKKIQEIAWKEIHTPEFWFRRHYNLPPTDERYLKADKLTILTDFWCYVLSDRWNKLNADGVKNIDLETLTVDEAFQEELEKIQNEAGNDGMIIDFDAMKQRQQLTKETAL